ISTGGTARALRDAGLAVTDVSDVTGFPEIMDGRVKTLHPAIHGGLLGLRGDADHRAAMSEHGIAGIDLLVVNLYPFEQVAEAQGDPATIIENIDIGGPAMIRAAAKNAAWVTVLVDPADNNKIAEAVANGGIGRNLRRHLAAKAFARTASYDQAIASWYAGILGDGDTETPPDSDTLPETLTISAKRLATLRYGENPHQSAALYAGPENRPGVATAQTIQGKPLSFNNINDADAAFELVADFGSDGPPAIAIIKHANPCGVATGSDLAGAHALALRCDPVSAFGGVVAANRPLDKAAAEAIIALFTEVVIAPDADADARAVFAGKPNLRLLLTGTMPPANRSGLQIRTVASGYLVQGHDTGSIGLDDVKIVTARAPTGEEMYDLLFAFKVGKHVKSNTIVYVKNGATVGIGAGQMSRVDAARIAASKAREAAEAAGIAEPLTIGSVVASDAFFPFADGLLVTAEAGATAIIQPGGSMRDDEVIAAADKAGLAMVFTGMRHFRH
ncbi:MAG: bifunctional phosphoribosylaminoimidazolecarboxamide formyltransferase/IMP cyclohydrolase, partial [Alphaproteobacteria bacterium]